MPVVSPERVRRFTYLGCAIDRASHSLTCRYRSGDDEFVEHAAFGDDVDLGAGGVGAAATLYFVLAGLSYYKTGAAHEVDLGDTSAGPALRALLRAALLDGLGEFAYRNDLSLDDVAIVGGTPSSVAGIAAPRRGPLVPFGGGIDSIVVASSDPRDDRALFVVSAADQRFEAIERPAGLTGLPIVRCTRTIDPGVRRGSSRWFDGHVPVTAMVSALATVAAVGQGRDSVVMSNERSASAPNLEADGRRVNHQWSKSLECEELFRAALAESLSPAPEYASALRDRSELWVAREFSRHPEYLGTFMSCNRAFRQDPAARASTWCGACDKCLFTDLVLGPFVDRKTLEQVFGGAEPIADPASVPALEVLAGVVDNPKPFECVGDPTECATAVVAVAARPDRADQPHLAELAARCRRARPLDELLAPFGPTNSTVLDAARPLV